MGIFRWLAQKALDYRAKKLIQGLKSDDSLVKWRTVLELGESGDTSIVPALLKTLEEENSSVRHRAIITLGDIGDARAVPALVKALRGEPLITIWAAVDALGKIGKPAIPALAECLKGEGSIPGLATKALAKMGEPAVPLLAESLLSEGHGARLVAAVALGEIGDRMLQSGTSPQPQNYTEFCAIAVPALLKALKEGDSINAVYTVDALWKIGDVSAIPTLVDALGDRNAITRIKAARALGEISYDVLVNEASRQPQSVLEFRNTAIPALVGALGDEDEGVRSSAAEALIRMVNDAHTIEGIENVEGVLKAGPAALSKKNRDRRIKASMVAVQVMKEITERKNQLASKRDILLTDKPKPPKRGKVYGALLKRTV